MIKSLTLSTLLVGMYQNPTYALLIAVALVFLIDLIQRSSNKKNVSESNYEAVRDLFKEADDIVSKDIYSDEEEKESNYIDIKCNIPDFTLFTYRDLQKIAKSLEIKKVNRKRLVLENELKHLLLDKEVIDLFH